MKRRLFIILYIIALLPLISGCAGSLRSSRRDMERLRPIRTISLDRAEDGVVMGVSSGIGPEGSPPLVMKCEATGIEPAISRLQSFSPEDELFYAHVRYILFGESMADRSVLPLLDWVERSPAMRMDTAMILVRGSAADALTDATGEATDITERLASLEREELARGQHIYSLREIASSLFERGSALCLVIRSEPSDGVIFTESEASAAVIPEGYAVLRDGLPAEYLTAEETMGTELLAGGVNGALAVIDGNVLEISSPGAEASGLWDEDGALTGVLIRCRLEAGVLEREEGGEEDMDTLEKDFSDAAARWLEAAAARSQALGCDFLDLEGKLMKNRPRRGAPQGDFESLLPGLSVSVSVEAQIDRSYDLSDERNVP